MNITIRKAGVDDWRRFSEIRLRALKTDPRVFGSNYERESKFTAAEWQERLRAEDSAVFLIFDAETVIGMTGVSVFNEDPSGQTAICWGSWLAPEYRRRGLSELMYRARIEWAKARPEIKKIVVSHRASNTASKFANQKHGFVLTGTHEKIWTDGGAEDEVCYELKLDA